MKRSISFILIAFSSFLSYAEPSLQGYLENDLELQNLALEVQKAKLALKQSSINNGIDVNLSTGTAKFTFSESGTAISLEPSVSLSVPQAMDLSFSASSEISITMDSAAVTNTSLGINADIISGSTITRKINLLKAQRTLLSAKRKLQNRALEAEKEYYTELKNLYNTAISIISTQTDLYDDKISFQEIQAKGYSKTSSKYRTAQLKVLSDEHEVETKIRDLEHDCFVFASKCNTTLKDGELPQEFLPKQIPVVDAINIDDYPQTTYTKIEQASYDQMIAELERQANKEFTLSLGTGYTFQNSSSKNSSGKYNDTIDISASSGWNGLTLGAGINLPLTQDNFDPIVKLSASVNPNKFRTASITKQTDELNRRQEQITIISAIDEYKTAVVDKKQELEDIRWSKETNSQTYDMYLTLANDLKQYLDSGVITESEYLSAFANKESYRIKMLLDDINLIIYNNETKLLFYRDNEIQD